MNRILTAIVLSLALQACNSVDVMIVNDWVDSYAEVAINDYSEEGYVDAGDRFSASLEVGEEAESAHVWVRVTALGIPHVWRGEVPKGKMLILHQEWSDVCGCVILRKNLQ